MELTTSQLIVVVLLLCISQKVTIADIEVDYYWRDYAGGPIPDDAVPGGNDIFNRSTYIGQGFVENYGVIPGTIYAGMKTIDVNVGVVKTIESYVKILCSSHLSSFKWIPVKADQFYATVTNKHLILGGQEYTQDDKMCILNIGRITFQGDVLIGKVMTGLQDYPGMDLLYYVDKDTQKNITFYELLTYRPHSY